MAQSSVAECNAALNARNALLNNGSIEIRTGAAADIDAAPTGSVLVTLTLPATAFASASSRASSMSAVTAVTASVANSGAQVHYVAKTSGGAVSRVGTAGTSGTDMILNTLTWSIGDDVSISNWTTSQPK
jgi:hypothetical protein